MPVAKMPRKLKRFVKPKRYKIAIGGRGSGKSMTIADMCLWAAQAEGIKTLCCREFQSSILDSSHALLKAEIERLNLTGFEVNQQEILYQGISVFKFKGLARNPESVKSFHDFNRVFLDEGQTISAESLKALTPTLRTAGSELWMAANPRSVADPFSQRFIVPFEKELRRDGYFEDDLHTIVWINWSDNPGFPDVLEQERLHDKKKMPPALYRHIWEGEYYDEHEDSIIPVEWFNAAIDAHIKLNWKPQGAIIASHDPSDTGGDSKGYALRHANLVLDVCEKVTGEAAEGMDWALDKAVADNADWFVWDCDGLGVSLKRQVDQALEHKNGIEYFMFKGSEAVEEPDMQYISGGSVRGKTNKDTFFNKRSQYWWRLRDRFEATYRAVSKGEYVDPEDQISLSSGIKALDQLRSEVCRIPIKRNNSGRLQVMSKIDMAKKPYQIPSPNMGDSLMMAMYKPSAMKKKALEINFTGWANNG